MMIEKLKYIRVLIILFLLISEFSIKAQELTFHVGSCFGSYRMGEMKQFVQYVQSSNIEIPAKLTDNYPSFWSYYLGSGCKIKNIEIGDDLTFMSTGSRLVYSDFSGKYLFNNPTQAINNSIYFRYNYKAAKNFLISMSCASGVNFNKVVIEESLEIWDEKQTFKSRANSLNSFIELGIAPTINFGVISLGLCLKYYLDIYKGQLKDGDDKLYNANGDKLVLDWSGYRIGFILSINPMRNGD